MLTPPVTILPGATYRLRLPTTVGQVGDGLRLGEIAGSLLQLEFASPDPPQPGNDGREIELRKTQTEVQWRYAGDSDWTTLALLSEITGPPGTDGQSGREIELSAGDVNLQWRYVGDSDWTALVSLENLIGPPGREVQLQSGVAHLQWRYEGEASWANLVSLEELMGPAGREVQLQQGITHLQWRYAGEASWTNLISLGDLMGPQGNTGPAGPIGPGHRSGAIYHSYPGINPTTLALLNNRIYYVPIFLEAETYHTLLIEVTTFASGSQIRLGLFANAKGLPSTCLVDGGLVDSGSNGEKTVTIHYPVATPGWYFLACMPSGAPTVRANNHASAGGTGRAGLGLANLADSDTIFWREDGSGGVFPATAGSLIALSGAGVSPRIGIMC